MVDPVQVVTEARRAHGIDRYDVDGAAICSCSQRVGVDAFARHTDEAIVAALKAAGALMPEEAVSMMHCPTCWARRDKEHNRMPIGFCHPTGCLMAKERERRLAIPRGCSVEGCHQPVHVSGGERCEAHALRRRRFAR